jgi:hypothetical protein
MPKSPVVRLFGAVLIVLTVVGCAPTVILQTQSQVSGSNDAGNLSPSTAKYAAVLLNTKASHNGNETNLNSGFKDRIVQTIRETGLFSAVYTDEQAGLPPAKTIRLHFTVDEVHDYNSTLNGLKGGLVGLSLFTLSPIIPLYSTFSSSMYIRAEKPDTSAKDYSASTKGESQFFFFSHSTYFQDLSSQVVQASMKSLTAQMVNDRKWLQE